MDRTYKPIAIIGYGCVFPPDGKNVKSFWENIVSGKNGISDISGKYWKKELYYTPDRKVEDKTYCKNGGIITEYNFPIDLAGKFGIESEAIDKLNKTQKMTLDTVLQALTMSGYGLEDLPTDTGFYIGNMLGDANLPNYSMINRIKEIEHYMEKSSYFKTLNENEKEDIKNRLFFSMKEKLGDLADDKNLMPSSLLTELKRILQVQGTGMIIDGACSGSGLVIDEAIKSIQYGNNKVCITSAVLGNMIVTGNIGFAKIGGLAENGAFPLDYRAEGLIPGEGAGTVILKDLAAAIENDDRIFGVIRGSGVASDGKGQSIYAPSTKGQLKAMNKTLEVSGLVASDIDYIETHATGTMVGDKVEIETIKSFFSNEEMKDKKIPIGSLKSQIGHSFSAAGMANLIKVIEGIRRKVIPPTYNYSKPPKGVELGNLYINTTLQEWKCKDEYTPRRAMVNAFGFGGINANILIEEFNEQYHSNLIKLYTDKKKEKNDFAIVGIGCYDANGKNFKEWRENVLYGWNDATDVPLERWNETVKNIFADNIGYYIENLEFPCLKFKIPPKILKEIDRSQLLALVAAEEAIEDYGKEKIESTKTGVFVGEMMGQEAALKTDLRVRYVEYLDSLKSILNSMGWNIKEIEDMFLKIKNQIHNYIPKVEEDTLPGYMDNIIAGRISNYFDLTGTNAVYDKDIISFNAALYQGILSLLSGENDLAVVGAVNGNMLPEFFDIFHEIQKNEIEGSSKKLLKNCVPAEGAVFFIIKRTCDVNTTDHVYARIHDIKECYNSNDIKSDFLEKINTVHPFYFGAHEGFRMLNSIVKINTENHENAVETFSTGNVYGEGYTYKIAGASIEINSESEWHIAYFACNDKNSLFDKQMNRDEFLANTDLFKATILYQSEKELNEKVALATKYIN